MMIRTRSTTVLNLAAALLAFSVFAALAILTSNTAHAGTRPDLPGIETTVHGVVTSSTLPHCTEEDGGPVTPCTWNVGPGTDGNGIGLAYVVRDHRGTDSSFDYVWASDPRGHGWHWSRTDSDCVVRSGHYRCPDGSRGPNGSGR